MRNRIIVCPECMANYPPALHGFLKQYGKCPFCDTPQVALLSKQLKNDHPLLIQRLPTFPYQRIDLDKYQVSMPFLEQVLNQMHMSEQEKQVFQYACKLELIRAQIKTELHSKKRPKITSV